MKKRERDGETERERERERKGTENDVLSMNTDSVPALKQTAMAAVPIP